MPSPVPISQFILKILCGDLARSVYNTWARHVHVAKFGNALGRSSTQTVPLHFVRLLLSLTHLDPLATCALTAPPVRLSPLLLPNSDMTSIYK